MDDGGALPPAVWASVVVSGVAFAGVVACAVCTPFVCRWYVPSKSATDEVWV